jgi:hypothetical protein
MVVFGWILVALAVIGALGVIKSEKPKDRALREVGFRMDRWLGV